jgi:hypothetical protein
MKVGDKVKYIGDLGEDYQNIKWKITNVWPFNVYYDLVSIEAEYELILYSVHRSEIKLITNEES